MELISLYIRVLLYSTVFLALSQSAILRYRNGRGAYGIIGSNHTNITSYPYTVSITANLGTKSVLRGGGAIINNNWILCSAYQLKGYQNNLTVRVGSDVSEDGGQIIPVGKIFIHKGYRYGFDYNIALIKTAAPIEFNENVQPVQLADVRPKAGSNAVISGFGIINVVTSIQGSIQAATVQIKSQDECKASHKEYLKVTSRNLCADTDGIGPCGGDYGDPLVYNNTLVGLFVGGDVCNFFSSLEVYSDVVSYRKWISNIVKKNSFGNENEEMKNNAVNHKFSIEGIEDEDHNVNNDAEHNNVDNDLPDDKKGHHDRKHDGDNDKDRHPKHDDEDKEYHPKHDEYDKEHRPKHPKHDDDDKDQHPKHDDDDKEHHPKHPKHDDDDKEHDPKHDDDDKERRPKHPKHDDDKDQHPKHDDDDKEHRPKHPKHDDDDKEQHPKHDDNDDKHHQHRKHDNNDDKDHQKPNDDDKEGNDNKH